MINGNSIFFLAKNSSCVRRVYHVPDIILSVLCVWTHFLDFTIKTQACGHFLKIFMGCKDSREHASSRRSGKARSGPASPDGTLKHTGPTVILQVRKQRAGEGAKGLARALPVRQVQEGPEPACPDSPRSYPFTMLIVEKVQRKKQTNKNKSKSHYPEISIAKILDILSVFFL